MKDDQPHEHSFYSKGRWLTPQVYVIGWASSGIVKVGSTCFGRRRYGKFLRTGGEMLFLGTYRNDVEVEVKIQEALGTVWAPAFLEKSESVNTLGGSGEGWTECFSVPASEWGEVIDIAKAGGLDPLGQSR